MIFKLLYFFLYAGCGIQFPYLSLFYENLGYSKPVIGLFNAIPNIAAFAVAPLFAILADVYEITFEIMFGSIFTTSILNILLLFLSDHFWGCFMLLISLSIVRSPLCVLIDAHVIKSLEDPNEFGKQRLYGAMSFGLTSLMGGWLLSRAIDFRTGFHLIVYISVGTLLVAGLFLSWLVPGSYEQPLLPKTMKISAAKLKKLPEKKDIENQKEAEETDTEEEKRKIDGATGKGSIGILLEMLKKNKEVSLFCFVVFASGVGSGIIDSFLFVRLEELGASASLCGLSRFITCASEIPFFHLAGDMQRKMGTWPLLALTQVAFVVRFCSYAMLRDPRWVYPVELLHGLTFAVMWSTACIYANEVAPPEIHNFMQSLLEGIHWGIGSGVGSILAGLVYQSWGAQVCFLGGACLSFVGLVVAISVVQSQRTSGKVDNKNDIEFRSLTQSDHSDVNVDVDLD